MKIEPYFRKLLLFSALSLFIVSVYSCYPDSDLSTADLDIVATDYDDAYFSSSTAKTYHLPDTVGTIGDGDKQLTPQMESFILDQISTNLDNLGWERKETIDDNDPPDVVVSTSVIIVTTVGGACIPWYSWWGWYPWPPGWGWGGGYCYPTYVYSYQTGTLVIDMIDPAEDQSNTYGLVWNAGINGLTRSSESGNQSFVQSTIDQAFKQSPYLKR